MTSELIGKWELAGSTETGDEVSFVVGVGRPLREPNGKWSCATAYNDVVRAIRGEDSLQALCLGLTFIRARLEEFVDRGGRLFLPDGGGEISRDDIGLWFSGVGRAGVG